jgi:hypothetical protein
VKSLSVGGLETGQSRVDAHRKVSLLGGFRCQQLSQAIQALVKMGVSRQAMRKILAMRAVPVYSFLI